MRGGGGVCHNAPMRPRIDVIREHLAQAEAAVALGQKHVIRQTELIAELDRRGHDTMQARDTLRVFSESLVLHEEDRERLLAELSKCLSKE